MAFRLSPSSSLWRPVVLAALLAAAAPTAEAAAMPTCSALLDGQTRCESASLCTCAFDRGGVLAGRVAAWRWTCDMLKMCGDPAPAGADPQHLPPGYAGSQQIPDQPGPVAPPWWQRAPPR